MPDNFIGVVLVSSSARGERDRRLWVEGLLDALEPRAQRILVSYFSKWLTSGWIAPNPNGRSAIVHERDCCCDRISNNWQGLHSRRDGYDHPGNPASALDHRQLARFQRACARGPLRPNSTQCRAYQVGTGSRRAPSDTTVIARTNLNRSGCGTLSALIATDPHVRPALTRQSRLVRQRLIGPRTRSS